MIRLKGGRASKSALPYLFVITRRSRMTILPVSFSLRSNLPTAWINFLLASGTVICMKGFPPFDVIYSECACSTGEVGTENGILVMMTFSSKVPGRSSPSEKLLVPNKIVVFCFETARRCFLRISVQEGSRFCLQ